MNRITAGVLVVVFLVGPPLATAAWIRTQQWRPPTTDQVTAWLEQPLTDDTILAGLAGAVLLAWLTFAVLTVRHVYQQIVAVSRRLRHLPVPTPAQVTAGSLAGIAVLAMPAVAVASAGDGAAATDTGTPGHTDESLVDNYRPATAVAVPGIELPGGGWIPYRTALAVTAIGTLIWLHRREHYTPNAPRLGRHHQDPDLQPLPDTAQTITAAVTTDDPIAAPPDPVAAILDALPDGPLTLHGPGAADAARGLLTTAVLHAALTPAGAIQVTIRPEDLRILLATDLPEPLPAGLDTDPAIAAGLPSPGLSMLLTRRPASATGREDTAAGQLANPTAERVTALTVGNHRSGTRSWHVELDGTISDSPAGAPRRLCALPPPACADLLRLVQHAARDAPAAPSSPAATAPSSHQQRSPAGRLTLLGTCRLQVHGTAVRLRRTAGLQILAYLAVHPDGATTNDLLRALWPGNAPSAITKRLHTTLTDLRHQLHGLLDTPVIRHHDRYLLNTDAIDIDLSRLRQAMTAAVSAVTAAQRQTALEAITGDYRGDLAAGYAWPWLQPVREQLRRDVIDAYLLLAESADAAQAAALLHAATTVDPYNADLHQRARTLLRATGDHTHADALDQAYAQRLSTAHAATTAVPNSTPTGGL